MKRHDIVKQKKERTMKIWMFIKENPMCSKDDIAKGVQVNKLSIDPYLRTLLLDKSIERFECAEISARGQGVYRLRYKATKDKLIDYVNEKQIRLPDKKRLEDWLKLPKYIKSITPVHNEAT